MYILLIKSSNINITKTIHLDRTMLNQNVDSKIGAMADEIQQLHILLDNIRDENLNGFLEKLAGVSKVSLECTEIEGETIISHALSKDFVPGVRSMDYNVLGSKIIDAYIESGDWHPILIAAKYGHHEILRSLMNELLPEKFRVTTDRKENVLHIGK